MQRSRRDEDFELELQSHLELAAAEFEAEGLDAAEARRRAALALGGRDAARAGHRDARGLPWLESVGADVRYALRRLVKAPAFAVSVIAILAVGIGANTAIFSVVNAVVLRPLPFADAERLVWIAPDTEGEGQSELTYPVAIVEGMANGSTTLDGLTTYFPFYGYIDFVMTGRGDAERLAGMPVGPRFFELLGVTPAIGRTFSAEELQPNGPRALLLTHATWQRTFASDPEIVGQSVTLSETPYTIIGVLPASFDFASTFMPGSRVDMFVAADYEGLRSAGNVFAVIGRLRAGVPLAAAQTEFRSLMPRVSIANPQYGAVTARLTTLEARVNARIHRSLIVLWAAVGLVLLIACANLSGLLLARTAARSKEIAVRLAIGAGRGRIVRQLLTESVVLSLLGASLGVPLAYALVRFVQTRPGLSVPLLHRVEIDGMALLFTALLAIGTSVIFGLLPAARVASGDPQRAMREQTRGSTHGRGHAWLRSALVVVEVALACVLLVGAGLLLRTFLRVQAVELGFAPTQVVSLRLNTSPQFTAPQRRALVQEVTRRIGTLPGVDAASVSDALPLDRNRTWGAVVPGRAYGPGERPLAFVYIAGPDYFRTMGIGLGEGRDFTAADIADTALVVIVNETLARTLYPGQSAVGRELQSGNRPARIVGVVSDVRQTSLESNGVNQMYYSYAQMRDAGLDLLVRTRLPAATIRAVDPTRARRTRSKPVGNRRPGAGHAGGPRHLAAAIHRGAARRVLAHCARARLRRDLHHCRVHRRRARAGVRRAHGAGRIRGRHPRTRRAADADRRRCGRRRRRDGGLARGAAHGEPALRDLRRRRPDVRPHGHRPDERRSPGGLRAGDAGLTGVADGGAAERVANRSIGEARRRCQSVARTGRAPLSAK